MSRILQGLQRQLALEHEAVWLYGLIGAQRRDLRARSTASLEAHERTRDVLFGRIHRLGAIPVGPKASYAAAVPMTDEAAENAAQELESRICAACLKLVGLTDSRNRERALADLRTAALAAVAWGAPPTAFPGL